MIRIRQANEEYEVSGEFEIYGTQEQLLKMASQLREGGKKVAIGWVKLDPDSVESIKIIKPFLEPL